MEIIIVILTGTIVVAGFIISAHADKRNEEEIRNGNSKHF